MSASGPSGPLVVNFSYGVFVHVWYLIVSIPDLCLNFTFTQNLNIVMLPSNIH